MIEEQNAKAPETAEGLYARLRSGELANLRLGLMHGRLSADEKDAAMAAFRAGEVDVLVCTTVIEVGVDVPNATVMLVMDADRFGISQLHQLRGRIGRGQHPSLCLFASWSSPDSSAGRRLSAVAETLDGFALADLDLKERREGDVLGRNQSGKAITLAAAVAGGPSGIHRGGPGLLRPDLRRRPLEPRNGRAGRTIHRHRPHRISG